MMKELLALEQELKEIQEEGNKRISEYQAENKAAIENEEEANKAVIKAKKGDNPKVYAKAIEDKRMASNIAQYFEGKIEQIKDEPFITDDDEGNDVFFHVTGCVEPKFNDLREGMKVNYLLSTRNDKPIAIGIVGI